MTQGDERNAAYRAPFFVTVNHPRKKTKTRVVAKIHRGYVHPSITVDSKTAREAHQIDRHIELDSFPTPVFVNDGSNRRRFLLKEMLLQLMFEHVPEHEISGEKQTKKVLPVIVAEKTEDVDRSSSWTNSRHQPVKGLFIEAGWFQFTANYQGMPTGEFRELLRKGEIPKGKGRSRQYAVFLDNDGVVAFATGTHLETLCKSRNLQENQIVQIEQIGEETVQIIERNNKGQKILDENGSPKTVSRPKRIFSMNVSASTLHPQRDKTA